MANIQAVSGSGLRANAQLRFAKFGADRVATASRGLCNDPNSNVDNLWLKTSNYGCRWSAPILDRHEDFIIAQRQAGASLRELQKSLRQRKTRASISTISRFIRSLPEERFQRVVPTSSKPLLVDNATLQRAMPFGQADRRQTQTDREMPTYKSEREFSAARSGSTGKILGETRGLAIGKARHGNHRDGLIHSIGTKRNYEGALTRFCRWIQQRKFRDLESVSIKNTMRYLEERSTQVGQKTLDLDRQAIQFLLRQTTGAEMRLERDQIDIHKQGGSLAS